MVEPSKHVVAIVGGAVAGSTAAEILATNDIEVIVIEQQDRPYGKIEDGLPRWHEDQRAQEYARIDDRLDRPNIHLVPRTRLGEDVDFIDLAVNWRLSALILANGAWRDRPLPVPDAEQYIGRGFEYQNPFIYWFNHSVEAGYSGPSIEVPDNAIVVGGGLASLDVVKACQLDRYSQALRERGHEVSLHELEAKGIPATCERLGVDVDALGIEGALLVYRRTAQDMPLAQPPEGATPEQIEKTRAVRQKILERAMDKYRFHFQDQTVPVALEAGPDGHITGLRVQRSRLQHGRVETDPESEQVLPTRLVVSSIGSLPERLPGIEMDGETYAIADPALGVYGPIAGVFAVGNVVTGQGNIRVSLQHAKSVTEHVLDDYLCARLQQAERGEAAGHAVAERVRRHLDGCPPLAPEVVEELRERVRALQQRVGYDGNYRAWIDASMPVPA